MHYGHEHWAETERDGILHLTEAFVEKFGSLIVIKIVANDLPKPFNLLAVGFESFILALINRISLPVVYINCWQSAQHQLELLKAENRD